MTKKKRHIRWDRLLLVLAVSFGVLYITGFGIYKLIDKLTTKPEIIPVKPIDISTFEIGPECPSIEEFNKMMEEIIEPEPDTINLGEFRLTGYCNCEKCCGVWAGGPCYNGEMPEAEWTVAVDPDVIPLNSYIWINGHRYKCCDTGSAIIEKRIDIYCNSHEECYSDFCNGYAEVLLEV